MLTCCRCLLVLTCYRCLLVLTCCRCCLQQDSNVICVDWAAGAVDPNYVRAAVNTRLVGKQVSVLINTINDNIGNINNNTHLVGFSLGAHVAGFVGKEVKNLSRITGTANPLTLLAMCLKVWCLGVSVAQFGAEMV